MYKEKKFFGLLALLLMGCGSMVAQSKLAPMVSAYVQQAAASVSTVCSAVSMPYR